MFDDLTAVVEDHARAVKAVGAFDAASSADDDLSDALVALAAQRAALEAAEARLTHTWDTRRAWAACGARNGATWLAGTTHAPKREGRQRLALGRAVTHMPHTAAAWDAGAITTAHVQVLRRACNPRTIDAFARDEAMLVEQAKTLRFAQLVTVVDYWLAHADPDGAAQHDVERAARRHARCARTLSGMVSGSFLLDPVGGTAVADELRRLEDDLFADDWASAQRRLGRRPTPGDLDRTPDQRRADALVSMAARSAGARADAKPLFTVLLGAPAFSHLCELASGTVVTPHALVPWLGEAEIERILFDGTPQRAISVSRKRRFTGALRRVLDVRDRHCTGAHCDVPAERCEGDHIVPWALGGATSQHNGRLECPFHNRRGTRPPPRPPCRQ